MKTTSAAFAACTVFWLSVAASVVVPTPSYAQETFASADVGAVGAAGSATVSGGVYTVRGAGEDVYGPRDEFHYYYRRWTGDGMFVARVTGVQFTFNWAKAGIMLRTELTDNAQHAYAFVSPEQNTSLIYRTVAGGSTTAPTAVDNRQKAMPMWLRLTRAGTLVAMDYSFDGVNWLRRGSASMAFPDTVYVGLAVNSHADAQLCTATFDHVALETIRPTRLHGIARAPAQVYLRWQDNDIDETGFEIERSVDNVNFTRVGTSPAWQLPAWSPTVQPPVPPPSFTDTAVSPSSTYYYRVRSLRGTGPSLYSNVVTVTTPAAPPAGWSYADVGDTAMTGTSTRSGDVFTVAGAGSGVGSVRYYRESQYKGDFGANVTGYSDEFQYLWQPWSGPGEIVARLSGFTGANSGHAGVMVRLGTGASAYNVFCHVQRGGGIGVTARPGATTGFPEYYYETKTYYTSAAATTAPAWLKIVRTTDGVMCYSSADGATWTDVAWVTVPHWGSDVQFGFGVSSQQDGTATTAPVALSANFDNVAVRGVTTPVAPPQAPANLRVMQVGQTYAALSWDLPSGTYERFEIEQSTDGIAFTRVMTTTSTMWTDASLVPNTTYHYRARTVRGGMVSAYSSTLVVRTPDYPSAPANLTATAISSTEVRLNWTDTSTAESGFTILSSTDSSSLTYRASVMADTTSFTVSGLTAGTTYYFAVEAAPWRPNSAPPRSNIATATPGGTAPPPPTGTWQGGDIGGVNASGSATESGGTVTLRASGADIWNTADEFFFRYQAWTGDGTITARVTGLTDTNGWAKAGVMFRESLAAGARHAMMITSVAHGAAFQYRTATGGESASSAPSGLTTLPRFVRLVRSGNTITGYESANGTTWTQAGAVTLAGLPPTIHVGLAATSHNDGVVTTATFDNVSVAAPAAGGDLPAPSNLVASASSSTQIDLTWSDNSSDETGFTVERSTDGANFTAWVSVGPNVRGVVNTGLPASTTYWYRVYALRGATASARSNTASATTLDPSLPPTGEPTWQSRDIGTTTAGATTVSGSGVTLTGSGRDIWNTADGFRYYFRTTSASDSDMIVRVASLTDTHGWAKAGVMFRESLEPDSPFAMMIVSVAHGTAFQSRGDVGVEASSSAPSEDGSAPRWLRLSRRGVRFDGYTSDDGVNWRLVTSFSSSRFTSTGTFHVGLVVTSHNDGALCTAVFDNVAFTEGLPSATPPNPPGGLTATAASSSQINLTWTDASTNETGFEVERSRDGAAFTRIATTMANVNSYQDTSLTPATTYYYRIRSVNGAGPSAYTPIVVATTQAATSPPPAATWLSQDIGAVAVAGSSSESSGVTTVHASGADIWDGADEFHYRYRSWTGDGVFVTRVAGLTPFTHEWAKMGLMFRESLSANSRHAFMCFSAARGVAFQHRATTGGSSASAPEGGTGASALRWLRLVRSGNTFTGYYSDNGVNWTIAGTATIAMPATIYVGFAATSHNDGMLVTAKFEDASLLAGSTPPAPTWSFGDIGTVGIAGSNTSGESSITVSASGADIWETSDSFRFVYRTMNGDCAVEAQVSSLTNTHAWAKAGVMIRESLAPNARNVFAFLTPTNGANAQVRSAPGGTTAFTPGPWGVSVPFWVRLERRGSQISVYGSGDGSWWSKIATYDVAMGSTVYVGFAVTSHDNTKLATAVFTDPFVQ